MATFQNKISEETRFALSVIKFFVHICRDETPQELQNDLMLLNGELSTQFTNGVALMFVILANELKETRGSIQAGISTLDDNYFSDRVKELKECYSHETFLRFMSWYGLKCTIEFSSKNYKDLRNRIEHVTLLHFSEQNEWDKFQEAAQKMLEKYLGRDTFVPVFPHFLMDMRLEQNVLLEIIIYVYSCYTTNVPRWLKDKLFLHSEDFSNTVKKSIKAMDAYYISVIDLMGWDNMQDNLHDQVTNNFKYSSFFHFCYCVSRNSVTSFYQKANWISPLKSYILLISHFKFCKLQGFFCTETSLEELKNGAQHVYEETQTLIRNRFKF